MRSTRRIEAAPAVAVGDVEITPLIRVREVAFGSAGSSVAFVSVSPEAIQIQRAGAPAQIKRVRDYRPWVRLAAIAVAVLLMTMRSSDD